MICDNCPHSWYKHTDVLSCWLPRCQKDTPALMARLREMSGTSDRGAEWQMLVNEIRRRNGE